MPLGNHLRVMLWLTLASFAALAAAATLGVGWWLHAALVLFVACLLCLAIIAAIGIYRAVRRSLTA